MSDSSQQDHWRQVAMELGLPVPEALPAQEAVEETSPKEPTPPGQPKSPPSVIQAFPFVSGKPTHPSPTPSPETSVPSGRKISKEGSVSETPAAQQQSIPSAGGSRSSTGSDACSEGNHWVQLAQELGVEVSPEMLMPPPRPAEATPPAGVAKPPVCPSFVEKVGPGRVPSANPRGELALGGGKAPAGRQPPPARGGRAGPHETKKESARRCRSELHKGKRRRAKPAEKSRKRRRRSKGGENPASRSVCQPSQASFPEQPLFESPEPAEEKISELPEVLQEPRAVQSGCPELGGEGESTCPSVHIGEGRAEVGLGLGWELARPEGLSLFSQQEEVAEPEVAPEPLWPESRPGLPEEPSAHPEPPPGPAEEPAQRSLSETGAQSTGPTPLQLLPAPAEPIAPGGGSSGAPETETAPSPEAMEESPLKAESASGGLEFLEPATPPFLEPEEILSPEDLFEPSELEEELQAEAQESPPAGQEPSEKESSPSQKALHRKVPTWKEVMDLIISTNLQARARRGDRPPHGRGGAGRPGH